MKKIQLVSIIDDDKLFQFSTRKILEATERIGEILQFSNGAEAIEYFLENKEDPDRIPDLVFLDINMPHVNGWEFLEKFTSTTFSKEMITVYICSSSDSNVYAEELASYPDLKGFLIKPVIKRQMFEVLDQALKIGDE